MEDVRGGKLDVVVVYKIDRLSRSLLDFAEIIGAFDRHGVTFVSVTQQFNTTTSMGRLTLNILLSFAQFEREIIGERIRDKIAMQKRRGMQTGGRPILGYDLVDSRLVVNDEEAGIVRHIFNRFVELRSTTKLARELRKQGVETKTWITEKGKTHEGAGINKTHIYRMLNNVKYIGKVAHKGKIYDGEHTALIDQATWDSVHAILARNKRERAAETTFTTPSMLKGVIRCGHCGCSMRPGWTKKRGKKYRYSVCIKHDRNITEDCPVRRISAAKAEEAVMQQLRVILNRPEVIVHTAQAAPVVQAQLAEADVHQTFRNIDTVWEHLFPVEQARVAGLLFDTVAVGTSGIDMTVKSNGLTGLMAELTDAGDRDKGAKEGKVA